MNRTRLVYPRSTLFLFAASFAILGSGFISLTPSVSAEWNNNNNLELEKEVVSLRNEVDLLKARINLITGEAASSSLSIQQSIEELRSRQNSRAVTPTSPPASTLSKSPEESLTKIVEKAAPSVASIVITKEVPQYEVTYENPFENDSVLRNFGIRTPVYRQKGTVEQRVGAGTGFIIDKRGYILTNRHVVNDPEAKYTVLLSNGRSEQASISYIDIERDVAIIKINGTTHTPLALGDSSTLKLGQSVIAIGNALGEYQNSISVGIISGLGRDVVATDSNGNPEKLSGVIQTDAAINPGNSGGPLLDLTGKVIGINVATVYGSNNVSFAIPSNTIQGILGNVVK